MTQNAKHTPGEWGYKIALGQKSFQVYPIERIKKYNASLAIKDYEAASKWLGVAICHCYGRNLPPDQSAEANARLIAAAPDLLEALKKITDKSPYAEERGTDYCLFCNMRDWQPHADDCPFLLGKAALFKATGEQS